MSLSVLLTSILLTTVFQDIGGTDEDFYQCVPGIGHNPGGELKKNLKLYFNSFMLPVSYPRGDIFHLVGTDNRLKLYCHLNPSYSYFKRGYDSRDLFFEIKGRGIGGKIILEKSRMETEILNDTTITSTFYPPEVAGIFDVR